MRSAAAAFVLLLSLGYLYLAPGSTALLEGRTDSVMSDDTDHAGVPYWHDLIIRTWEQQPSRLFYGSVLVDNWDPTKGHAIWTSWSERWLIILGSYLVPLEQNATLIIWILLVANGMAMFALGKYLRWNTWVSAGLGIAWAFCAFTRARAKVHGSMVAQYHLPLIFLALYLIVRGKTWRSIAVASAGLLIACTVVHYFLVTTLFLSPFFLVFVAIQPETRANWKLITKRFALATVPAVLFLGLNFAYPTPSESNISAQEALPKSGETTDGSLHPFLTIYAAKAVDYFTGDIALQYTAQDINPLRSYVNAYVLTHLENSNPHERTNGVRWSIWILAILAVAGLRKSDEKATLTYFVVLALFGFWLSLSPNSPIPALSPSAWLHGLISQVRVPSRAGILVHFSLLMLAGFWLAAPHKGFAQKAKGFLLLPAIFPLLMVADYPPLVQGMPMAKVRPVFKELQPDQGNCGVGFYFPFANNTYVSSLYYFSLQQMRGSTCQYLNNMDSQSRIEFMTQKFPPEMGFLENLDKNLIVPDQIVRLAKCVPLSWIAFDSHTPQNWRERMCAQLGWTLYPDLLCVAPDKGRRLEKFPDECI